MLVKRALMLILPALLLVAVFSPMAAFAATEDLSTVAAADVPDFEGATSDAVWAAYDLGYSMVQTDTLEIDLDTSQLFNGAQVMIDALSSPYLLLAGFSLGVAILAAIMKAVRTIRV